MSQETEILRDTSTFTICKYISFVFTVFSGLLIAKFLGPGTFGVFSALMILVSYSQYSNFGLFFALTKKVPFYRAQKQFKKIRHVQNAVFSGAIFFIVILSLIILCSSFFFKELDAITLSGLRLIAIIIILQQLFYFYQNFLMVEKNFSLIGKIMLLYSFLYFAFVVILIFKFALLGVLSAMLCAHTLTFLYTIWKQPLKFRLRFVPKSIIRLIKLGLPLMTMGIISIIFLSIDKLMIIWFMGKIQLGYYSIATMIAELIYFIPQAVGFILFPHFLEKYGQHKEKNYLKHYVFQPTIILAYLLPSVIGFVFFTAPFAIYYLLPKYIPSVVPIKIIICSVFFTSILPSASNFLITINKEKSMIKVQLASIALTILLNYVALSLGYGIVGVAIATGISFLFYSVCILVLCFKQYFFGFFGFAKFLFKIFGSIIYSVTILMITELYGMTGDLFSDIMIVLVKLLFFGLCSLPLIWMANKKTGILSLFAKQFLVFFKS